MNYHLGSFGVVFVAVILALFSFSTFLGILFYARSNVSYLFGNRWLWQTLYKNSQIKNGHQPDAYISQVPYYSIRLYAANKEHDQS